MPAADFEASRERIGGQRPAKAKWTLGEDRAKRSSLQRRHYEARRSAVGVAIAQDVSERMKALERENRELRQANEILRKASAYFAMAELDRRSKQ